LCPEQCEEEKPTRQGVAVTLLAAVVAAAVAAGGLERGWGRVVAVAAGGTVAAGLVGVAAAGVTAAVPPAALVALGPGLGGLVAFGALVAAGAWVAGGAGVNVGPPGVGTRVSVGFGKCEPGSTTGLSSGCGLIY
jgi:hypothetical protein